MHCVARLAVTLIAVMSGSAVWSGTQAQTKGTPAVPPPPAARPATVAPIEVVASVGHEVSRIVFSKDGRWIATGSSDQVKVWEAASGRLLRSFPAPNNGVGGIAFSPDARTLAIGNMAQRIGSSGDAITLYDLVSGAVVRSYNAETWACDIVFTPNGQTMVSAGCGRDPNVSVWSVQQSSRLREFQGGGGTMTEVQLSPDGRTVYAQGSVRRNGPRHVLVFDLATGSETRKLPGTLGKFSDMMVAADGSFIAVAGEAEIRIVDAASGMLRRSIASAGWHVALSPDGRRLASGHTESEELRLFDVATGAPALALKVKVDAIAYAPDGQTLVVSNSGTAEVRDAATGEIVRRLGGRFTPVTALAAEPFGKLVAVGGGDGQLFQWDVAEGALKRRIPAHTETIQSLSIPTGGRFIASGAKDDTASIWQVADGARVSRFEAVSGNFFFVPQIAVSPDGQRLSTLKPLDSKDQEAEKAAHPGERDESKFWLQVRNVATGTVVDVRRRFASFAQSADGSRWALNSMGQYAAARLVEIENGAVASTLVWANATIDEAAFSPDGSRLAVTGSHGVEVWDLATSQRIKVLHNVAQKRGPQRVAYSADGRWLAVTRDDGIEIWNARTLERVRLHAERIEGWLNLHFTPDGNRLVYQRKATAAQTWEVVALDLTGSTGLRLIASQNSPVLNLSISRDGRNVVVVRNQSIGVHELATGREIRRWDGVQANYQVAVFTPDSTGVAANIGNAVVVRNVASGAETARYPGLEPPSERAPEVTSVAYTSDRAAIVITYADGSLQKLTLATRQQKVLTGNARDRMAMFASPDARRVLQLWSGQPVVIEDVSGATTRPLKILETFTTGATRLALSTDGRYLVAAGTAYRGEAVRLIEVETGRVMRHLDIKHRQIAVGNSGQWIAVADERGRVTVAMAAGGEPRQLTRGRAYDVVIAPGADPRHLLISGSDGAVRIYDVEKGELLASLVVDAEGEWLVLTPEGFFSASSPKAAGMLSIVRGTEVIGIEQLYQSLYRPDLVQQKLAGDPKGLVREASAKLDLKRLLDSGAVPRVEFNSLRSGDIAQAELITVEADVADQGGGIGRVEWRLNGVTIGVVDGSERGALPFNRQAGGLRQEIYLDQGENVIEVVAYNRQNLVASIPTRVKIVRPSGIVIKRPRLFILAIGVNDYFDSRFALKYAVPDARKLIDALKESGRGIYEDEVEVVGLFDADVSIEKIDAAFTALAPKVKPNDVFVFFGAGHGVTHDGRYFFLPRDFRFQTTDSYAQSAIGQDKWQAWFAKIAARKALLIFDTCESGTLTEDTSLAGARGGLQQAAAIGRLIQATGRLWLTAAAGDKPAREGHHGHGVFTYALLDALGRGDRNGNDLIEISEIVGHIDAVVPDISEKRWGQRQVPQRSVVGNDFPLGRQVARLSPAPQSEPIVISVKPTHIVPEGGQVFAETGGRGIVVRVLDPFTLVTMMKEEGGYALIAKEGERLGYLDLSRMKPVR